MLALRLAALFGLASALGCSAEALDAGSTRAPAGEAATTRATLHAMIDAVAMDEHALYLTSEDGWLYRVEKAGTSPPSRVAWAAAEGSLYTEGVAVDDAFVYWTALGDGLASGAVFRAPKGGGDAELLAPSQARPWSIAVRDGRVVWTEQGAARPFNGGGGLGQGAIERIAPEGNGGVEVLASALNAPDELAIDDAGGVVWHEGTAIRRLAPSAGAPETLLERPTAFRTTNLVAVGGAVAWADEPADVASVWSASASGKVTAVATGVDPPASLAASGGALFWSVATGADVGAVYAAVDGAVRAVAPADDAPDAANERALFLLADDRSFYEVVSRETDELTLAIRVVPR